jgi:4-coumarate--CoA ligase (photoactive yellow protein activation family)
VSDVLDKAILQAVIRAVILGELARLRGPGGLPMAEQAGRDRATLDEAGLGLDSLEQMGVRSALDEFFAIEGQPQSLDDESTLTVADWVEFVVDHWRREEPVLWMRSSGTTGTPKLCRHRVADLIDEAKFFAGEVGPRSRVLALVPGDHIYGLIWTVLLPGVASIPVSRLSGIGRIPIEAGDLVIAAPDHWRAVLRSGAEIPADVVGVNAAAPLGIDDKRRLLAGGLARMIDVYGSSETGGIGMREALSPTYTLLPRWRFLPETEDERRSIVGSDGTEFDLPDTIVLRETGFELGPRRDGMVQVGGKNVDPEIVATLIRKLPLVAEVAVRLGANNRLKAFLVPQEGVDGERLIAEVADHAAAHLPNYSRPVAYRWGTSLPRNALGKLADWH